MDENPKTTYRNNYSSDFTPSRNGNKLKHQRFSSTNNFDTNLYDLPEGCEEIPGLKDFLVNKVIKPIEVLCQRSSVTLNDVQSQLKDFIKAIQINAHSVYGNSVKLHNANNDLESTLKQLNIKFNLKDATLGSLTKLLKDTTLKLKNTEEKVKNLTETNKTQVTELESKTNKISELESEVNTLKERKEEIERENKETKSKLNNTTNALKSKTEEFDKLTEKNKEIEEVLKSKTNKISELESEVNVLKENNKKNAEELNETKSQLEKTGKELSNQKLKLEQKQTKAKEDKEQISKVEKELKNLKAIKKQTAEMFLLMSGNTNVTARKFSLIYFFAWVFSWLSTGCKNYICRIRVIRDLNEKFDTLRSNLNPQDNANDVNSVKNVGNELINSNSNNNSVADIANDIFDNLDSFLPKFEGELFNKYACIYINMLNLYQHDTSIIFGTINQTNTPLMRNKEILDTLKKCLQASSNKNIINEQKVNSNNIHEEPHSYTIPNQSNEIET